MNQYAAEYSLKMENSAIIRAENNKIARHYQFFFLMDAAILFTVGCVTSFALLKSRLTMRKRELSLLCALGARVGDITKAVIPETVADYAAGALFSIVFGALGFWGMMMDGGGTMNLVSVLTLCCLFLTVNMYVQIRVSKRITSQLLANADNRL